MVRGLHITQNLFWLLLICLWPVGHAMAQCDVSAGPDVFVCKGDAVIIGGSPTVKVANPGYTLTWDVIGSADLNPSVKPPSTRDYIVRLTDGACTDVDTVKVHVYERPVVVAMPDQEICSGDSVYLFPKATSSAFPILYYAWEDISEISNRWKKDQGIVLKNFNPLPEALSISVNMIDSLGCSVVDQVSITVNPNPIVEAGTNQVFCDQPVAEVLGGYSPLSSLFGTGTWSGVGVTADGVFTPSVVGVFPLTYTYVDNHNCRQSDQIQVTVNPTVYADAGPLETICLNDSTHQLIGFSPAVGGQWSGLGVTDVHVGLFDAGMRGLGSGQLLFEYGEGSCYTKDFKDIEVIDIPVVTAGPLEEFCGNILPLPLQAASPTGGIWSGNGITDGNAGLFDPGIGIGNHLLCYSYQSPLTSCVNRNCKMVTVHSYPISSFSIIGESCSDLPVGVTNTTAGATSYNWNFGEGPSSQYIGWSPVHQYAGEGDFDISLVAHNNFGCSDTAQASTRVLHPPVALFSGVPDSACAPYTPLLKNLSTGLEMTWNWEMDLSSSNVFEPLAPVYTQDTDTVNYQIMLNASNRCGSDSHSVNLVLWPQPLASFSTQLDTFCSPFEVIFDNQTLGLPTSYYWDLGDGSNSNLEVPPAHLFYAANTPVDYDLRLYATNGCGVDSVTKVIRVMPNTLSSAFHASTLEGCAPLSIDFSDASSPGVVQYTYDFGDNTSASLKDVSHLYSLPGQYKVTQFINDGCSYSSSDLVVTIKAVPAFSAKVVVDEVCAGETVYFQNTSPDLSAFNWDLGEAGLSTDEHPKGVYSIAGNHLIHCSAISTINACGARDSLIVKVNPKPMASIGAAPSGSCSPVEVDFSNLSQATIKQWWDLSNGEHSAAVNPKGLFLAEGNTPVDYKPRLIVENTFGCRDTAYHSFQVFPLPKADFELSEKSSCGGPFSPVITDASISAITYLWQVNGHDSASIAAPSFTLTEVGDYTLRLEVANTYGCEDEKSEALAVYVKPQAILKDASVEVCVAENFTLQNASTDALYCYWDMGDGYRYEGHLLGHAYSEAGSYDVLLKVVSDKGCKDSLQILDLVTCHPLPRAHFVLHNEGLGFIDQRVVFENLSENAVSWTWELNEEHIALDSLSSYVFDQAGMQQIKLKVLSDFGCVDERVEEMYIEERFNLYLPNAFTPNGDGVNDVFAPTFLGGELIHGYKLQIFNRWGKMVFETDNIEAGWNGLENGEASPQSDTYAWQIELTLKGIENSGYFSGSVTLVR